MKRREVIKKLECFLDESETFAGVTVQGLFGMPTKHFLTAFEEYLRSGENYIDEYTLMLDSVCYAKDNHHQVLYYENDIKKTYNLFKNESFWNIHYFYSDQEIANVLNMLGYMETRRNHLEKDRDYRNCKEYQDWRESVFKRDHYVCQKCDKKGGMLNAHHVLSFKNHPAEIYEIENGLTLCAPCHKYLHKENNVSE